MINLLSTMTNSGCNASSALAGPSSTAEYGHCNPLDDSIVAEHQGDSCVTCVLDSSDHGKKSSKSKKTSVVELVPIVTVDHNEGGYVNQMAFEERANSKDNLNNMVQEYRLENDSDDSSHCVLKPTIIN